MLGGTSAFFVEENGESDRGSETQEILPAGEVWLEDSNGSGVRSQESGVRILALDIQIAPFGAAGIFIQPFDFLNRTVYLCKALKS